LIPGKQAVAGGGELNGEIFTSLSPAGKVVLAMQAGKRHLECSVGRK